jgi:hypothetical protein
VLTLRRARRPLVILCLAAVALAVFVPGAAVVDLAPPPPDSILLPQLEPLDTVTAAPVGVEQPHAFRSALPERAPPVSR